MSDLLPPPHAVMSNKESPTEFILNSDVYASERNALGSRHGSVNQLLPGMITEIKSYEVSSQKARRCKHPWAWGDLEGFEINPTKDPDILEIRFYDRYFDITVLALGGSWAGRFLLLRQRYWNQLFQTCFRKNENAFRLINIPEGYGIGGSCCTHGTRVFVEELGECLAGRILLAENYGGWRRLMLSQFTRFLGVWRT